MWEIQETLVQFLGQEDPLEEGMATHSSILARSNPWTEEPVELQSMKYQRVRHDRSNWTRMHFLFSSCIFFIFPSGCLFYNPWFLLHFCFSWLSLTPPGQGKGSKDRRQTPLSSASLDAPGVSLWLLGSVGVPVPNVGSSNTPGGARYWSARVNVLVPFLAFSASTPAAVSASLYRAFWGLNLGSALSPRWQR